MDSKNINSITLHHTDMKDHPIMYTNDTISTEEINRWRPFTVTDSNSEVRILELETQIKELLNIKIDSLPMIVSGIFSLNSNYPVSSKTLENIHNKLKEAYDLDDIILINASGNLEDLDSNKLRDLIKSLQNIEFNNAKEHLDTVVKNSSCEIEVFYRIIKMLLSIYSTPYLEPEVIVKQIPQVSFEDQEIIIKFKRN